MVKIEIVVVMEEIVKNHGDPARFFAEKARKAKATLEQVQRTLCDLYGGLTVIPNTKGLWKDESGNLVADRSEIWQIFTASDHKKVELDVFDKIREGWNLWRLLKVIQTVTAQRSQFVAVNNEGFLLDAEGVKSV